MRIATVLLSVLVAGGIGCKRHRDTTDNQPAPKPVETNTGDQSTTRSTSDYPPGGVEGQPAQPASGTANTGTTGTGAAGTGPAATPATGTGERATGTGTANTDSMGTPANGATSDAGVNQQGTQRGRMNSGTS